MEKRNSLRHYFSRGEIFLWSMSMAFIISSFVLFDRAGYLKLIASVIGVTSLLLNAKGNPIGQVLMIIFSILYGVTAFTFAYYGEMLTYLGMTAPMAVVALISWLRNPFHGNRMEVKVNCLKQKEVIVMFALTAGVTTVFYRILDVLGTANLIFSTLSVTTSFLAVYLTFRRSAYFALAYAVNDTILIVLWTMASLSELSYLSVMICFAAFFINDIYGYISWRKMWLRQQGAEGEAFCPDRN